MSQNKENGVIVRSSRVGERMVSFTFSGISCSGFCGTDGMFRLRACSRRILIKVWGHDARTAVKEDKDVGQGSRAM